MAATQLPPLGPHAFPPPPSLLHNPFSRNLPVHNPFSRNLPARSTLPPLVPPPHPLPHVHPAYPSSVHPGPSHQYYPHPTTWSAQDRLLAPAPLERVLHPVSYSPPHARSPMSPRERMQISQGGILGPDIPPRGPSGNWQPAQPRSLEQPEISGRYPYKDDIRFPAPSPRSPIHSTSRSSASSYSSPRAPSDRFAARPSLSHRSNSGLSSSSAPPTRTDAGTNPFSAASAPNPSAGPNRYRLSIRQQPIAARACGQGERDRRTIDPPPILQLSLTDFDSENPDDMAKLRWPMNIVHCALHSTGQQPSDTDVAGQDVSTIKDPNNSDKHSRRLMGTLVANPFIGMDPEAQPTSKENSGTGCFFIFHDLSCRQNGLYRLHFTLVSLNVESLALGARAPTIATVESDVFEVYSAKDFPGMRASSLLTRSLKAQGANVQVKKGSEGKVGQKVKRKTATESDNSGSDGSDNEHSSKSKGKKRRP